MEALRRGPKCTHFIWTVIPGKTREGPGRETGPGGKAGKRELPGGLSLRETEGHPPWASGSHGRTGLWRRPLGDLPTPFLPRPLGVIPEHEPSCTTASPVTVARKITALGRDLLMSSSALFLQQVFTKHPSSAALLGRGGETTLLMGSPGCKVHFDADTDHAVSRLNRL